MDLLAHMPATSSELAYEFDATVADIEARISELRQERHTCFIVCWEMEGGEYVPVWRAGKGFDARRPLVTPKPKPKKAAPANPFAALFNAGEVQRSRLAQLRPNPRTCCFCGARRNITAVYCRYCGRKIVAKD